MYRVYVKYHNEDWFFVTECNNLDEAKTAAELRCHTKLNWEKTETGVEAADSLSRSVRVEGEVVGRETVVLRQLKIERENLL